LIVLFKCREIDTEAADIERSLNKLNQIRYFSVSFRSLEKFPPSYTAIFKKLAENMSFVEERYKLAIFSLFSEDTESSSWKRFLKNEVMLVPRLLEREDLILFNNQIR
jgi:hypothetical protein